MSTVELPTIEAPDAETSCSCCPHPAAGHDTIAARFCEATQRAALTRNCICRTK